MSKPRTEKKATGTICRIPIGDWYLELVVRKEQVHDPTCNQWHGWSTTRREVWWLEHDGYRTETSPTTAVALILARAAARLAEFGMKP